MILSSDRGERAGQAAILKCNTTTWNGRIVITALKSLTEVVCLLLADGSIPGMPAQDDTDSSIAMLSRAVAAQTGQGGGELARQDGDASVNSSQGAAEDLTLACDAVWAKMVDQRLTVLLKSVLTAALSHPSSRVRSVVGEFCGKILRDCARTLPSCVPVLLGGLSTLLADVQQEVARQALGSAREFSRRHGARSVPEPLNQPEPYCVRAEARCLSASVRIRC